jgi:FkbM family methyltransferase
VDRHPVLFPWRVFGEIDLLLRSDDTNMEYCCFVNDAYMTHVAEVVRAVRGKGCTFYDVGANIGLYSMLAAVPSARPCRVYAFEPSEYTRARLHDNVTLNNAGDVITVVPVAVGDREGVAEFEVSLTDSGTSSLHRAPLDGEERVVERVRIAPLDQLVRDQGLEPPAFMKIDVEGHELFAVRGAEQVISEHRPGILLERNLDAAAAAGWEYGELLAELERHGYRFWEIGPQEFADRDLEHELLFPDILCLPTERGERPGCLEGILAGRSVNILPL